jgi:hypothetical protein
MRPGRFERAAFSCGAYPMSIFARREMVASGYVIAAGAILFGLYHLFFRHDPHHVYLGYMLLAVGVVVFTATSFAQHSRAGLNPLRLLLAMLIAAALFVGLFQDVATRLF